MKSPSSFSFFLGGGNWPIKMALLLEKEKEKKNLEGSPSDE
jgi:hypothetical protein